MRVEIAWARRTWRCALRKSPTPSSPSSQFLYDSIADSLAHRPSLMGTHTGSQIADASLQARVLDTILGNATAIFDED